MCDQEMPETCPCCGAENADPVTGEWICDGAFPYCSVACMDVAVAEERERTDALVASLAEEAALAAEWRAMQRRGREEDETAHYRSEW